MISGLVYPHEPIPKKKFVHKLLSVMYDFAFNVLEPDLFNSDEYGKISILDRSDFSSLTFPSIKSKLASIDNDFDALYCDYAQCFKYFPELVEKFASATEAANSAVLFLKDLAIEFEGRPRSVVLLAQTSRDGFNKATDNEGEYSLTALSELSMLEKRICLRAVFICNRGINRLT